MGRVGGPVAGFEVEVAAEESMEGDAGWESHVGVCWGGAVVPFVVFSWGAEAAEGGFHVYRWWFGGDVVESWGAFEGVGE